MRTLLITYTDDRMTRSALNLCESAIKHGIDSTKIYTPADLSEDFKTPYIESVLAHERGAGFYCWKPYVCNEAIKRLDDGDILVWCDAGTTIIANMWELFNRMDDDILFFSNGFPHVEWCKMDLLRYCFKFYGVDDGDSCIVTPHINGSKQVQASQVIFKVTERTRQLIAHWLDITMRPGMVDNEPSVLPNFPTFQEHRWDQSILCCLQIMYGYKLHWFPSTYGYHIKDAHPDDHYPAMFDHHRRRNSDWK